MRLVKIWHNRKIHSIFFIWIGSGIIKKRNWGNVRFWPRNHCKWRIHSSKKAALLNTRKGWFVSSVQFTCTENIKELTQTPDVQSSLSPSTESPEKKVSFLSFIICDQDYCWLVGENIIFYFFFDLIFNS